MTSPPASRLGVWLLPIVLAICALMLLPGGAVFGAAAADHPSSSGAQAAGLSTPSSVPVSHTSPAAASPVASSGSSAPSPKHAAVVPNGGGSPQALSGRLAKAASQPGLQSAGILSGLSHLVSSGAVKPSSVYLPNLNELESAGLSPQGLVGIGYTANPAPMGIGDFGLGVTPYAYNSSHVMGSLTLSAANATYPGAYYFMGPASDGDYNSPYYFGIQLNTVTNNISIPGDSNGAFWTQNVVTLNGNTISFIDNIWNFSSSKGDLYPGTLYSYNGIPVYPEFYYDYGPSFTLTFPVTINLYNNASVVGGRDQVTFGYRIVDSAGTFTGVYDTVVFNSPSAPTTTPGYEVSGKYVTPLGLGYDSELDFGGPGGGSNAVFNNISGTETLEYSNQSAGGWKVVPSAYDFGGDTGETAVGVAETYSTSGVVSLSPGPSLLYGMWNSPTDLRAASGSIEFQGTLTTPDWGFAFVGDGTTYYNQSYMPLTATGGFLTYLPPVNSRFPISGQYAAFFLADGYTRTFVTFTTAAVGVSVVLATSATYASPLYVNGNAQAESAATLLEGWTTGAFEFNSLTLLDSAAAPANLDDSWFFDRLNDWGFVSFNLFQATGVTDPLELRALYQGDSGTGANAYFMDGPMPGTVTTVLGIAPAETFNLPQYGELVAAYSDTHLSVLDQDSYGIIAGTPLTSGCPLHCYYNLNPAGGATVVWNSAGVQISGGISYYGSFGDYIAASPNAQVAYAESEYGANAVTLAGSNDATVTNTYAYYSVVWHNQEGESNQTDIGVYDLGSSHANVEDTSAYYGAIGYLGAGSVAPYVNQTSAWFSSGNISNPETETESDFPATWDQGFSIGVDLEGTQGAVVNGTYAVASYFGGDYYNDSLAVAAEGAFSTTISNTFTDSYDEYAEALAVNITDSDYTNVSMTSIDFGFLGGLFEYAQNTTFVGTSVYGVYYSMAGAFSNYTTFNWLNSSYNYDDGVAVFASDNTVVENANASYESVDAVDLITDANSQVKGVIAYVDSTGVEVQGASPDTTITDVSASVDDAVGVYTEAASGVTITDVTASESATGVITDPSVGVTVSQVSASDEGIGVYVDDGSWIAVSDVNATNESIAVEVEDANNIQVSTVSVTNTSIGVVVDEESSFVTINGVTATATSQQSPWTGYDVWDGAVAAVDVYDSSAVTVSDVTATFYGAALYTDEDSGISATNLNDTGGFYGLVINDTEDSQFTDIGAYQTYQGVLLADESEDNTISQSSFVDDQSYGVADIYGEYNTFYDNWFIGDNGATNVYNPSHIQAYAVYYDNFNVCYAYYAEECTSGLGNHWADWHTYGSNGYLAPYLVTGNSWDYFPIGPQETFTVQFTQTGLAMGTTWSVTLSGVTVQSTGPTLNFTAPMGAYDYQVNGVAGYTSSPASGTLTLAGAQYNVSIAFTQVTFAVTLSASGLGAGTAWSATVDGSTQSTTGSSIVFYLPAGTGYAYAFDAVSGYNLPSTGASGTFNVTTGSVNLATTYSPTSTPSYVQTGDFDNWLAVALAIAVIALVVGLLAVFLHRRKQNPPPQGAQPWTPPPAAAGESGAAAGGSTSAPGWSEGPPPSGEAPPPPS